MKQSVQVGSSLLVAVLLGNATGVAQSRSSGQFGRGWPYSSGGEWSWGPCIFIGVLFIIFLIAGMVREKLKDQPRWHTLIVVAATLLSAVAWTVKLSHPYPAEIGVIIFMLIPSLAGIALLYLAIMGVVQIMQGKGSK